MPEFPSCSSESNPKARKQHRCCECRGFIQPGEKYHVFKGIWEGEASTWKSCEDCQQLRNEIGKNISDPEDYPAFGLLSEHVSNNEFRPRFVAIMQKRGAQIHPSWLKEKLPATQPQP